MCVDVIKESTYGKGEDVWKLLPLRQGIAALVGSKSQQRLFLIQEGLTHHPNIMYRLCTAPSRRGRKPREYRYVSAEEKIANQLDYSAYNHIDRKNIEYIKEKIKNDVRPEMFLIIFNIINALNCLKAEYQWIELDIDKFTKRVLMSSEDIREILSFLKDQKLLIQLNDEPFYHIVLVDQDYDSILAETKDPEKIKASVGAKLVTIQNRSLLVKSFLNENREDNIAKYSTSQINRMLGDVARKRLNDYFDMEQRLAALEKENETLRAATKNTLINNDMSMNTFEALQEQYQKQLVLISKQEEKIKLLEKGQKRYIKTINSFKKELSSATTNIDKLIDDYLFLDKSQLKDPRIVKQLKSDIHVYAEKITDISSNI